MSQTPDIRRLPGTAFLALLLLAAGAEAQIASAGRVPATATVTGVVFDSLSRAPLADASVQLVSANNPAGFARTATSDSLGRFTLTEIPDGLYTLGFFHPLLDSLGVIAPLREVFIGGQRPMQADLAVPSPARLRVAICGKPTSADSGAVVTGVIRN
ncbi:MAG TPA: carboxypeptidase-like regulatory domain-containing protein, partial [Gemmatimonadaceae bacterium]